MEVLSAYRKDLSEIYPLINVREFIPETFSYHCEE
jgi:hypothetical protein